MKKGFTLIELLAVIVILAIIALIATPIVLNIIEDSKKSAFMQTGNGIVDAAEYYYMNEMSDGVKPTENKVFTFNGSTTVLEELEFDGEIPKEGTITVDVSGNIQLEAHNNQYCIIKGFEDNEVTIRDYDGNCSIPVCTLVSGTAKTPGAKYECNVDPSKGAYTFYVLSNNEDGTTNLIMNQNINSDGTPAGTTGISQTDNPNLYNKVVWHTSENNADGPITVMNFLYNATKEWTNVPPLNYEYNDKEFQGGEMGYKSFISINGEAKITSNTEPEVVITIGTKDNQLRARLPIYSEDISKTEVWKKTSENTFLYENIPDACSSSVTGYWTLSSHSTYSDGVWTTYCYGVVTNGNISVGATSGVRPVITLQL